MAESLILNGNSSITKGTVIFEKGQPLQSTALILKGRVIVQGEGVRMTIGSGNFLGMCDVWKKEHSFSYVALDDLVLFGLPMENEKQAALLLEQKPQYRGLLVTSLNFFYHDVFRVFGKLKTETEKVAEFVHQTYSRYQKLAEGAGLTAEKIATHFHVSRAKLDRDFTASVGQTLHQAVNDLRLAHAKQLLETTALPVSEIAARVGISSEYYFYAFFRRMTGLTPLDFRKHRTS